MRSHVIQSAVWCCAIIAALLSPARAAAQPAVVVHPGMEVRQDGKACTIGYVDPAAKVALTAGHCQRAGRVSDAAGNVIGRTALVRTNSGDGTSLAKSSLLIDYAAIVLSDNVIASDVLPSGRSLLFDDRVAAQVGQRVCVFGVTSGASCGSVQAMNNGWFTMADGVLGSEGDSGAPVYALRADGEAAIVGMLSSLWGRTPAAVSWQAVAAQLVTEVEALTSVG